jgi:hypothetical protein
MTLESLAHNFVEYVSWLYRQRPWAGWELAILSMTVLVMLLLVLRLRRRKAEPQKTKLRQSEKQIRTVGIKPTAEGADNQWVGDCGDRGLMVPERGDGEKRGWKRTTEKWRNYGALVEQLRHEVAEYKRAEENFKQQLAKLKAANERLQQELTGKGGTRPDLGSTGPLARFSRQPDRMLDIR